MELVDWSIMAGLLVFIIVVAAAEAAVGLAIIMAIYRSRKSIDATQIDLMKW